MTDALIVLKVLIDVDFSPNRRNNPGSRSAHDFRTCSFGVSLVSQRGIQSLGMPCLVNENLDR